MTKDSTKRIAFEDILLGKVQLDAAERAKALRYWLREEYDFLVKDAAIAAELLAVHGDAEAQTVHFGHPEVAISSGQRYQLQILFLTGRWHLGYGEVGTEAKVVHPKSEDLSWRRPINLKLSTELRRVLKEAKLSSGATPEPKLQSAELIFPQEEKSASQDKSMGAMPELTDTENLASSPTIYGGYYSGPAGN